MLNCYLLALCAGSALDKDTNSFTLFSLVEGVGVSREGLGQTVPMEVHAYFLIDPEDRFKAFEMRVVRISEDGREEAGQPLPFKTAEAQRSRVRVRALRIPSTFGLYKLRLEWREEGQDAWHADPYRWPLDVTEVQLPTPTGTELPTP